MINIPLLLLALLAGWMLGDNTHASEITRDPAQVRAFKAANACPATGKIQASCPGYIVDHKIPLCAGGEDSPSNMQWQTKEAGLQKDKLEWWLCQNLKTCPLKK